MGFSCALIFVRSTFLWGLFWACLSISSCPSGFLLLMGLCVGVAERLEGILLLYSELKILYILGSVSGLPLCMCAVKNNKFSSDGVSVMRPGLESCTGTT